MKLFRRISRFLITYLVVLSVSSCLYAESVTVAVANSSSYAVDRTIRFSKRCGMKAERVKSTNININKYDGLILPGGSDVSPSRYGQKTRNRHTYGCSGKLDDFQIRSVTEGRTAMGETVVRLLSNGKLFSGRGISTDIVAASVQAYINALNKIAYEEEEE